MSKIKMLVTDIGGTLLSDNNTITKDNIKAFKYAKEKGINIVLATARMYSSTKYISNIIKADYGVYGNGVHLMDIKQLKTLKKEVIDHQIVQRLIKYAKERYIYIHLSGELFEVSDQIKFFALKHILLNKNYRKEFKTNILVVKDLLEYINGKYDVLKLMLVSENYLDKEIGEILNSFPNNTIFLNEYYKDLKEHAIKKTTHYAEFGGNNATKATGIVELAYQLGIEKNEIMAIGDLENDIEMLSTVGYPVAMNNGKDKVKRIAEYVTTRDNNNSGVAEAIYKYI